MNLSQFNKHAQELDSTSLSNDATANDVVIKICELFHKVKPFLESVSNLFFLPKKWRNGIKSFNGVLSALCPKS